MAGEKAVLDELISFLGEPIFQIPVRSFMDEHSIIFDPSIEFGKEHEEVHKKYKYLVDTLLNSFLEDVNKQYKLSMTQADIIKGIKRMNEIPDVKEVFQVMFEQVFAAMDYEVFKRVMTKRNIMIQEQVLLMIIASTGCLPKSMQFEMQSRETSADTQEQQELQQVMKESKRDHERLVAQQARDDRELKKIIDISKKEAELLKQDRQELEEDLSRLALSDAPPAPAAAKASRQPAPSKPTTKAAPQLAEVRGGRPPGAAASQQSSGDAASDWLKSAMSEAGAQSATHAAMAAKLSGLSEDELRKRQEYLRKQRDLLMAKKKELREKQLEVAQASHPQRPASARTARRAMDGSDQRTPNVEDERKMAMRRAIADRLKQEVINK